MHLRYTLTILSTLFTINCAPMPELYSEKLPIALIDQEYSYQFEAVVDGDPDRLSYELMNGSLPEGFAFTSEGALTGTSALTGVYSFDVNAIYDVSDFVEVMSGIGMIMEVACEVDSDCDNIDSSDYHSHDTFELFITEASTNSVCPLPDDESTSGYYFCLGELTANDLDSENNLILDVTLFEGFEEAKDSEHTEIELELTYDSAIFEVDQDKMNKDILREAADYTAAQIQINAATPGTIMISLTAQDKSFSMSGRLLDIPLRLLQAPEATSDFSIAVSVDTNVTVISGSYSPI